MFIKRINIASTYGVYVFFSILYSVFPLLVFYGVYPDVWYRTYELMSDEKLVSTLVILISLCNVVFASVYLLNFKRSLGAQTTNLFVRRPYGEFLFFIVFCVLSILLTYYGYSYSYTSGRSEVVHSVISNLKTILAGFYVAYLVYYGFGLKTFLMLILFSLLMVLEGSRWYFVSVLFATLVFIQNSNPNINNAKIFFYMLPFLILLSWVGLERSSVDISDYLLLLNPFYIEGTYGSYMVLQTYDVLYKDGINIYTFFIDYLIDPILYLIPRFFYIPFGVNKDEITIFSQFVNSIQPALSEEYAPVGGFHYIAQASSALPFLGPLIVTYFFAKVSIFFEKKKYSSGFFELYYYIYISGFSFVFIKTVFHQTIKYGLTLAFFSIIFYLIMRFFGEKTNLCKC